MRLLDTFFKNRYLRAYEKAILYAVRDHLSMQDRRLFEKQLMVVDRGARSDYGAYVGLYSSNYGRKGDWPKELLFPKKDFEILLAKVSLRNIDVPERVFNVDVILSDGRLACLVFYALSTRVLNRADKSKLEIVNVDILSHLTHSRSTRPSGKHSKQNYSGWLGVMANTKEIVKCTDPIPPEEETKLIEQWHNSLPVGYLEVIQQSNGLVIDNCEIYSSRGIWKITIPDGEFLALGEIFFKGYFGVLNPRRDNVLCLFSHEDGVCEDNCGLDEFSDFLTKVTTSLS